MNPQPAKALNQLNNKVVEIAMSGRKSDEMQFHRFIREAQNIAPGTILNDIALVLVNGAYTRFEEADKAIQRSQQWSSISPHDAYDLAAACVFAWRPGAALDFIRYSADGLPSSPQHIHAYFKFSQLACAVDSMNDALQRWQKLGRDIDELNYVDLHRVADKLKSLSIKEASLMSYIRKSAELVRAHFEKEPFHLLVTNPRLVTDHDTGDDEVWFDFVLHASPEKGAEIEWDLAFTEMPEIDQTVKENVNISVRLVDEFEDLEITPEVVS